MTKIRVLRTDFFNQSSIVAAKKLLGKFLVRKIGKKILARKITEVEVYEGLKDRGSHASKGKTERNKIMFGPAGRWYIYLNYGMHWMLNIVTRKKDFPAAILIRGVEGINGPGRVTKFFKINKFFNGQISSPKIGLWIEDRGVRVSKDQIKKGPRIGIDYAGPYWSRRHLRFWIKSN